MWSEWVGKNQIKKKKPNNFSSSQSHLNDWRGFSDFHMLYKAVHAEKNIFYVSWLQYNI